MSSFNKTTLLGNLTRNPALHMTQGGLAAKFGLAMNRKFKTKEGEKKEETTFVDCVAFGKNAELIQKYVEKGNLLFLEGRLKFEQWETDAGERRSKLGVLVENIQLMPNGSKRSSTEAKSEGLETVEDINDDDVPF